MLTDTQWAKSRVAPFPPRWQANMLAGWERQRNTFIGSHWLDEVEAKKNANLNLLRVSTDLAQVRVPLDAGDADICQRAQELADQCAQLAQVYHQLEALRQAMERKAHHNGIKPPHAKTKDHAAIARMVDVLWWRRQLRKLHAKNVEGAAIQLGYVNKAREIYVSNESLHRRTQQNRRNAEALENTIARNEDGQEFTLAELSAKGTANKAIRRAELMTRIAGFERIARDMEHAGLFFTITCPSRMHKWRTVKGGRVMENPRYDGTTPRDAQAYLAKVWARIRASLKRQGIGLYGFRIAEPNHDGTPHWHLLVFHELERYGALQDTVKRYALQDSPNENGAHLHRVDFKRIDWSRGSAAGYIAKYVAKNIDGYKLEKDLFGNDAMETSARVEAWAATWGIRQFQQVGGPPVGPWRELRRVKDMPANAPAHLQAAHRAVNKLAVIEGRDNASVAWDSYTRAQGGVFCGRNYRIRIATKEVEGVGRYGEPIGHRPIGVETTEIEKWVPKHIAHMVGAFATRVVHWVIESSRYVWEIVGRKSRPIGRVFNGPKAPWTCVNNCTDGAEDGAEKNEKRLSHDSRGVGKGSHDGQSDSIGIHGAFA